MMLDHDEVKPRGYASPPCLAHAAYRDPLAADPQQALDVVRWRTAEHALRHLSGIEEAGQLRTMFETGRLLACQLAFEGSREAILQDLIAALQVRAERIEVELNADAMAAGTCSELNWSIPLPDRKPFREAKLRIDSKSHHQTINDDLLVLLVAAKAA